MRRARDDILAHSRTFRQFLGLLVVCFSVKRLVYGAKGEKLRVIQFLAFRSSSHEGLPLRYSPRSWSVTGSGLVSFYDGLPLRYDLELKRVFQF
jgi:hypothetical protein